MCRNGNVKRLPRTFLSRRKKTQRGRWRRRRRNRQRVTKNSEWKNSKTDERRKRNKTEREAKTGDSRTNAVIVPRTKDTNVERPTNAPMTDANTLPLIATSNVGSNAAARTANATETTRDANDILKRAAGGKRRTEKRRRARTIRRDKTDATS